MNEPYFYANLAHHLAIAGILEPGLWAKLREVAPERLRGVLPEELPDRLGDTLAEKRPELDDLRAWIEAARQFVPADAEDASMLRMRKCERVSKWAEPGPAGAWGSWPIRRR